MPTFKSLNDLKKYVNDSAQSCMDKEVAQAIKKEFAFEYDKQVYSYPNSEMYERREDLSDEDNFVSEWDYSGYEKAKEEFLKELWSKFPQNPYERNKAFEILLLPYQNGLNTEIFRIFLTRIIIRGWSQDLLLKQFGIEFKQNTLPQTL